MSERTQQIGPPTARWAYRGFEKGWECSRCSSRCLLDYEGDFYPSPFCPHCGAMITGKDVPTE